MHSYHTYIKHVAENIQKQRFLKLERLSFSTLKMSQNVFFVQRTNHKLGNAISMYWPHDPIFKQWEKMCDLQTLSRCDWVCYMIWFQNCSEESCCLKSLFFQHIIMTWCFHGLYFIQNKFKKTVLEKLAAPDFLKLYHHKHFFEHLVFKKRRVMFWSAPENICSPWFSQDVIRFLDLIQNILDSFGSVLCSSEF